MIVTDRIEDTVPVPPDESGRPENLATSALIDLIRVRFHEGHRRQIAELLPLARRVEAVHPEHPACPRGLGALLTEIWAELEPHMAKEEQILFPLMLRGGSPMIIGPITCMVMEHDDFGDQLRRVDTLTAGFVPPADACGTWRALYLTLGHFVAEAREHVRLENDILFPRFAAVAARGT